MLLGLGVGCSNSSSSSRGSTNGSGSAGKSASEVGPDVDDQQGNQLRIVVSLQMHERSRPKTNAP